MSLKFNINRPKISDEEIERHQDFDNLVKQFKEQSLKKARGDESWWKNKRIRYSTVIAGVTVICTITYLSLFTDQKQNSKTNETPTTQNSEANKKNKPAPKKAFVYAPSEKLKINYASYTINNARGGEITHHTASKIKVPKNSFVDKNGNDIVGDVTIEYREFHDLGDVIASGIPMHYDSAGIRRNFETAGMFDIRGYQNNKPVFIKPEKQVQVHLASLTDEKRFNQYYLDTLDENWKFIGSDNLQTLTGPTSTLAKGVVSTPAATNKRIETLQREIEMIIPKKIDSVKTVYNRRIDKLTKASEPLKPVKQNASRPNFVIESDYKEYPELATFDNVLFEVGDENKNYDPELHDITWSDLEISQGPVKGKNYLLTLVYRNRNEKLIVYPVLNEKDYKKAKAVYEDKLAEYENVLYKRKADEKRLLAEMEAKQAAYLAEQRKKQEELSKEREKLVLSAKAIAQNNLASNFNAMNNKTRAFRIFELNSFGIYNSDCAHVLSQGKSIEPVLMISDKQRMIDPELIYLVDHDSKQVFMLDAASGFKMNLNDNTSYSLCVFRKKRIYVCTKNTFKTTLENGNTRFVLSALNEGAENLADFKKTLEI